MEEIKELNKYLIPELSNIVDEYLTCVDYQYVINELMILTYYHRYTNSYSQTPLYLAIPKILKYFRANKTRKKLLKH
jgi:hypothetical protein